jgi:hypothetical protein
MGIRLMNLMRDRANGNRRMDSRVYQETPAHRRHPNHRTFSAIDCRLTETGLFQSLGVNRGNLALRSVPRTVWKRIRVSAREEQWQR